MFKNNPKRRQFLKSTAAVGAGLTTPYFVSSPARAAESDRMKIGVIGAGGMASGNINTAKEWLEVVAIAEADSGRADGFNNRFAGGKADIYADYRELLSRGDFEVVHVATPDHWHTKPVVEAMYAGKDIYCEKPLTLTIDEGKLIRKVQKETGRIVQVGTQQRSTYDLFVKAMAIVNEGRLGNITRVQAAIGGAPASGKIPEANPPAELDWERWLGPAPRVAYRYKDAGGEDNNSGRGNTNAHYEFRWWYEYSGGKLTDWGAHHVDICNWALTLNGQTGGPESISGSATHPVEFDDQGNPVQNDRYNTATAFNFSLKYAGGTELVIRNDTRNGVLIEGEKGRIFVSRGALQGGPVEELETNPLPEDAISKVYKGLPIEFNERKAHWANFLHCVRERKEPISDVHSHMKGLNLCHLAGIAARTGRDLKWDDAKEEIVGDEQANSMLSRPYREGYEIEMGDAVSS
ncbi:Inositol 2-dehydrogenase [Rubripirellula amarantea]|uniref:Inositol 2-dehydrogenase n=1 Tax=Rubripirellula amarantea TaxID=2527999 RepID=A0A5C5WUS1_9BACT|nr:Gfo/Idh/MocA family oxidoreductase [Rubripirellula amarantea]TWT54358.1 Inositol 2-dehydrogenase [Rubripirellula amarantea]